MTDKTELWLKSLSFAIAGTGALTIALEHHSWGGAVVAGILVIAGIYGLWSARK